MADRDENELNTNRDGLERDHLSAHGWSVSSTFFSSSRSMGEEDVFRSGNFSEDTFRELNLAHVRSSSEYSSRSRAVEDAAVHEFIATGDGNRSQFQFYQTESTSPHFFSTSRTVEEHAESRQFEMVERNFSSSSMQFGFSNAPSVSRVTEREVAPEARIYSGNIEGLSMKEEGHGLFQGDAEALQSGMVERNILSDNTHLGFLDATSASIDADREVASEMRTYSGYTEGTAVVAQVHNASNQNAEAMQSEMMERNISFSNPQSSFSDTISTSGVIQREAATEAQLYGEYAEEMSNQRRDIFQERAGAMQFGMPENSISSSTMHLRGPNATSEHRVAGRGVAAEAQTHDGYMEETSNHGQDTSSGLLSTSRFAQGIPQAQGTESSEQSTILSHTESRIETNELEDRNCATNNTDGHSDMIVQSQTASSELVFTEESLENVGAEANVDKVPLQTVTPDLAPWETRINIMNGTTQTSERRKGTFLISHAEPTSSPLTIAPAVKEQEMESGITDSREAKEDDTYATARHMDQSVSISPAIVADQGVTEEDEASGKAVEGDPLLFHTAPALSSEVVHTGEEKEISCDINHHDSIAVDEGNSTSEAGSLSGKQSAMGDEKNSKTLIRTKTCAALDPTEKLHLTKLANDQVVARVTQLTNVSPGEPYLNPESRDFSLYRWLRKMMCMLNRGTHNDLSATTFQNLHVLVFRPDARKLTAMSVFSALLRPRDTFSLGRKSPKSIVRNLNGVISNGELLLILGRPGAGCSTVAKTLCGKLDGLKLGPESVFHYQGIPHQQTLENVKRASLYNYGTDKHFPYLTVGQTLEFAASSRAPTERLQGITRTEYAKAITEVVVAVFGLSHTYNTKVKDVPEGERKRVSIAEIILSGTSLAAWDKSTQGLASTEALKFVQSLRLAADLGSSSHVVAAYEASEAMYDLFDRTLLLYEGRQIFYGSSSEAKGFFERQGWYCHPHQSTAEFLTSITNPTERQPRRGMENRVPRTPKDFETYWCQSREYQELQREMSGHKQIAGSHSRERLLDPKLDEEQKQLGKTQFGSQYPGIMLQVRLTTIRAFQRAWNERASAACKITVSFIIALLIGSMFYNTPATTAAFFSKGSVLFYLVMLNSFLPLTELSSQLSQRSVVEKHASFGFYHPMTESLAILLSEIPKNFLLVLVNTIVIYFMSNLRREPSQFFICFLINFVLIHVASAAFRMTAAVTKTLAQVQALAGMLVLWVFIFTGFIIREPRMPHWFEFVHDINPIYYAYEALVANEFHGREFGCAEFVPSQPNLQTNAYICSAVGAVAGRRTVSGDDYIWQTYKYTYDHVWRNFGILIVFLVGWMGLYFVATEFIAHSTIHFGSKSAYLRREEYRKEDEESGKGSVTPDQDTTGNVRQNDFSFIEPQRNDLSWRDVVCEIQTSSGNHRILDQVTGRAKPGTITALMSHNSVQKAELLKVLAQRSTTGTVSGDILFNNCLLGSNFQRKIGYVQQQDIHLETATVRETLRFSAVLRQPHSVSKEDKHTYVEQIIKALEMEDYADSVVGVVGEGLNVKQRRLLSLGVELAAKPEILFVEEPVSGLDVQSSRAIYRILQKLADAGQTILCTLQPSMMAFKQVDQLLFLSAEGRTVYFGSTGDNAQPLLDYLESNGAPRTLKQNEDDAEYIVEILSTATNRHGEPWSDIWAKNNRVDPIHEEFENVDTQNNNDPTDNKEFAIPLHLQLPIVFRRTLQQYWRSPLSILSRILLQISAALIISFSFYKHGTSISGLQETIFSAFMICTLFIPIVHQITPFLTNHHTIYQTRERLTKTYSSKVLILSLILTELLYQIPLSICVWAIYYYPISDTTNQSSPRQGLVLLFFIQFFIYAISFALLTISTSTLITGICTFMALTFNGVMQPPHALPGFWMFMYRVSPFTYFVAGVTSTQLHGVAVNCSSAELAVFDPPSGQTCVEYLGDYLKTVPGRLMNPEAMTSCEYCPYSNADQFLAEREYRFDRRWMDFGVGWAFVGFNLGVAVLVYHVFWGRRWRLGAWEKVVMWWRRRRVRR
ncbi:ABC multidrug transporter [Aspergillus eucalypticola CBS 122712]|uniref:ABC multidrug transporter n=1 Tax=Aspergillus eucalypticola (strain CBS 122712 / IBT 29274) TaxID=1448314 RepID=A0A317VQW6_ASPEC|nr:ABC multidrug transporter [Aspergillus eucalypticola CBS 122712]PWY76774.1 ABC multidrug transporter [Aspergillus eucalypticola CBS 122712]